MTADALPTTPLPPLPPQPEGVPWPTKAWPEAEPDADVDRAAVDAVYQRLVHAPDPARTGETRALVCIHRGRLVAEAYSGDREGVPYDQHTPQVSWSMAKSITHALVGILVREGRLDPLAPAPIPAWHEPGDPRAKIRTEDLMRMVDGLDFLEAYIPGQRSNVIEMLFQQGKDDVAGYAMARAAKHEPGRYWSYSSGTSNILAHVVSRTVGGGEAGLRAFMRSELFEPLGMHSADPRFDAAGNFIGSSYVWATARDFARFGLLYLRGGEWEGRQLLPPGWVDHGRTLTPASFDQYGAHWWLARDGTGIFHASGFRGQYIVVVPTRDLVIVRLGDTDEDIRFHVKHLLRDLTQAFPPTE